MPTPRFLSLLLIATLGLAAQPAPEPVRLPAGATVQENIPYDQHPQTVMDIYKPAGPGPHPAMIVIHGGGWTGGAKASMVVMVEPAKGNHRCCKVSFTALRLSMPFWRR